MRYFLRFWTVLTILALAAALVLTAALILPRFAGLHPYPVPTDRIEGIPAGSLLCVRPVGDDLPAADESVIYVCNPALELASSRIASFDGPNGRLLTDDGAELLTVNVLGRPVFSLPLLGYAAGFLARPSGTAAAVCAVLILFGVRIALELVFRPSDANLRAPMPRRQRKALRAARLRQSRRA